MKFIFLLIIFSDFLINFLSNSIKIIGKIKFTNNAVINEEEIVESKLNPINL